MNLFVGLGFQKCATTWLSIRLRRHSQLYVPPINELRYWNHFQAGSKTLPPQKVYLARWTEALAKAEDREKKDQIIEKMEFWEKYSSTRPNGPAEYGNLFSGSHGAKSCGEISPSYVGLSEETHSLIEKSFSPKVFIIMREPLARIWSQIRHEARLRPENVSTHSKMVAQLESESYRIQADYSQTICRLRNVFPEDRIGMFFFEDMLRDEQAFLQSICGFIGVPYEKKALASKKRPSKKNPEDQMPAVVSERAIELYGDQAGKVELAVGRIPANWIKYR